MSAAPPPTVRDVAACAWLPAVHLLAGLCVGCVVDRALMPPFDDDDRWRRRGTAPRVVAELAAQTALTFVAFAGARHALRPLVPAAGASAAVDALCAVALAWGIARASLGFTRRIHALLGDRDRDDDEDLLV